MNSYRMFMLETLTNMHVGSGDTNFGVVDNLIQRHPVTKAPVIHSSGIKGALLDYFKQEGGVDIDKLFGGKIDLNTDKAKGELAFRPGHLIFFEANMLTIPLRANYGVFYHCTSLSVIREYFYQLRSFTGENSELESIEKWFRTLPTESKDFLYFKGNDRLEIEDYTEKSKQDVPDPGTLKILKDRYKIDLNKLAIFNEDIFKRICETGIPVVARNQIKEDGTSGNLFYEEILPRRTNLYFLLGADSYIASNGAAENFFTEFTKEERIYQFGANYSIGYGFSRITEVALEGVNNEPEKN